MAGFSSSRTARSQAMSGLFRDRGQAQRIEREWKNIGGEYVYR